MVKKSLVRHSKQQNTVKWLLLSEGLLEMFIQYHYHCYSSTFLITLVIVIRMNLQVFTPCQ